MSYVYKYNFISPNKIFAEVKEELKSYFDTGIVDDLMFPVWSNYLTRKLGKAVYPTKQVLIKIVDYMADLPENFYKVREVYACHKVNDIQVPSANSVYEQTSYLTSDNLTYSMCVGCVPDCVTIVSKTQGNTIFTFKLTWLLTPGNIETASFCDTNCQRGQGNSSLYSFDIHDNKLIVRFREGTVFLTYYEEVYDDDYNNVVPDFPEFENYLRNYLKYKCFEIIYNTVTDETYRQVQEKLLYYEKKVDECFIIVKSELMKKTAYQAVKDITTKTYRQYRDLEM